MKTKISHAFVLVLVTLVSSTLYGQAKKEQAKKDTIQNWEVGLDLLWLINKNQLPATSIFARHNFVTKTGKHRALRFRLGVNNSYYDSSGINGSLPTKSSIIALFARIGYEWQVPINKQFIFFYGADANIFFYQNKYERIVPPSPNFLVRNTFTTWELGVVGLIGFKYRATNWLSISIESTLSAIYRIKRDALASYLLPPTIPNGLGETNVDDFRINFLPITIINLSFTINNLKHEN
jgi:hypothetical protein